MLTMAILNVVRSVVGYHRLTATADPDERYFPENYDGAIPR